MLPSGSACTTKGRPTTDFGPLSLMTLDVTLPFACPVLSARMLLRGKSTSDFEHRRLVNVEAVRTRNEAAHVIFDGRRLANLHELHAATHLGRPLGHKRFC